MKLTEGGPMEARNSKSMRIIFSLIVLILGVLVHTAGGAQELAKEQVVVTGLKAGDIGTLDPHGGIVLQDRPLMLHLYGALVRHPIGNVTSPTFEPDLAQKWEVSPDKVTWTFHLRRGVQWHWGFGEVTSEDIVFSLNRVRNSKASAFRGTYENFKEIKAIDKYTVQITTSKPEPFLLTKVANYYGGYIVSKKALEKAGAQEKGVSPNKDEVIGTGPFKLVEYKPKDRIILTRNDDYWKGKPIIEGLIFRYIADDGARELAMLKGEVATYNGLHDQVWLKHMKSKGVLLSPMGPPDLKALYFNLKVKPFDDKRVREAFAYGIGQQAILDMQGKDISNYCTSPVPSGTYGHIDAGWGKYNRDPDKAKRLLAEAGYASGLPVKLFMSRGAWYLDKFVVYQNLLKEVGIHLDMTVIDHTAYIQKITQGLNPVVIWGSQLPLATYWLQNFYHTDSIIGSPKAMQNFMYYSKPEMDKLIELAETSFDEKTRLEALSKAQRMVIEDLPAIPSVETYVPSIRNPWLDLGYEPKSGFNWTHEIGPQTKILKH
jgi:peptide/nickel transport system substrate-binding protein